MKIKVSMHGADQSTGFPGEANELRWFLLPSEAKDLYRKRIGLDQLKKSPFRIRQNIEMSNVEIARV